MKLRGRSIGAGDVIEVFHGGRNRWERFKISDYSPSDGGVYGHLEDDRDGRGYHNLRRYGANIRWPD